MRKMLFVVAVVAVVVLGGQEVATAQENGTVPPQVWLPIVGKTVNPCREQEGAFGYTMTPIGGSGACRVSDLETQFEEDPYPWADVAVYVAEDPEMKEIVYKSPYFKTRNGGTHGFYYRWSSGVYAQFHVICSYPNDPSEWWSEVIEYEFRSQCSTPPG